MKNWCTQIQVWMHQCLKTKIKEDPPIDKIGGFLLKKVLQICMYTDIMLLTIDVHFL